MLNKPLADPIIEKQVQEWAKGVYDDWKWNRNVNPEDTDDDLFDYLKTNYRADSAKDVYERMVDICMTLQEQDATKSGKTSAELPKYKQEDHWDNGDFEHDYAFHCKHCGQYKALGESPSTLKRHTMVVHPDKVDCSLTGRMGHTAAPNDKGRCLVCRLHDDSKLHAPVLQIADEWRSKGEEAARQLAETVIPKDLVRWEIIAVGEAVRAHMGWQKNSADKKEEKEEPRLFGNVERTPDGFYDTIIPKPKDKTGSTGYECCLVELEPGQWYYALARSENAEWDSPDSTFRGPYPTEDACGKGLSENEANPGGYNILAYDPKRAASKAWPEFKKMVLDGAARTKNSDRNRYRLAAWTMRCPRCKGQASKNKHEEDYACGCGWNSKTARYQSLIEHKNGQRILVSYWPITGTEFDGRLSAKLASYEAPNFSVVASQEIPLAITKEANEPYCDGCDRLKKNCICEGCKCPENQNKRSGWLMQHLTDDPRLDLPPTMKTPSSGGCKQCGGGLTRRQNTDGSVDNVCTQCEYGKRSSQKIADIKNAPGEGVSEGPRDIAVQNGDASQPSLHKEHPEGYTWEWNGHEVTLCAPTGCILLEGNEAREFTQDMVNFAEADMSEEALQQKIDQLIQKWFEHKAKK